MKWVWVTLPRCHGVVCSLYLWYFLIILTNFGKQIYKLMSMLLLMKIYQTLFKNFTERRADIIEAFNSTSRYLDDLLNIDNPYFEQMVGQIYPTELQLNKANSSDTEAPFLDLELVNNKWHSFF